MGSGKSTQLLQICHDYEVNNNKNVLVLKPSVDTKAEDYVITRMGNGNFKRVCNFLIDDNTPLFEKVSAIMPDIVLVDEAQFLTEHSVKELVLIATMLDVPVICFGLRTTFDGKPFEGSTWLFALAQNIEEIQTRALSRDGDNDKRATMNLRLVNGIPTFEGDQVAIDGQGEVTYIPVSLQTFMKHRQVWERKQKGNKNGK